MRDEDMAETFLKDFDLYFSFFLFYLLISCFLFFTGISQVLMTSDRIEAGNLYQSNTNVIMLPKYVVPKGIIYSYLS